MTAVVEFHDSCDLCVDGEIASHADIFAGMNLCAALADDYLAPTNHLAAKTLDAPALAVTIATISL